MKAILKQVRLQNFKNHKDDVYVLGNKTDIYGKNAVGKTSIGEAIRFAMFPSKKDVDKISIGEEKAVVTLLMVVPSQEKEIELEVRSSVTRSGVNKRSVKFDGIAPQNPASFLKELISFGTFNPRDIIESEGREQRLLNLFPSKVSKEDFKDFNLHNPGAINFNENAFIVLGQVEKDLKNTKLNLYQKKDMLLKHYKKYDDDLAEEKASYKRLYPEQLGINYKEFMLKNGELSQEIVHKEKALENMKEKLLREKERERDLKSKIDLMHDEINKLKQRILLNEKDLHNYKTDLDAIKVNEYQDNIDTETENISKLNLEKSGLRDKMVQAERWEDIKRREKELDTHRAEAENSKNEHDNFYDKNLLQLLPKVREKILKPLRDKVPGFDMSNGKITIDGKSIDELSTSECLALGVKLMSLENKTSFIVVDCGENMDKDTINKTEWTSNVVLIRVSEEPLGLEDWKSIKIL